LLLAVSDGTGNEAQIPHYEIAGKTGTAQRVSPKGGYEGYVASFIGFPVNVSRKFVVFSYVDHPTKNGYYGGAVAAPIFKKITQYILYKKKDFAQFAKYDEKSNKLNMDTVNLQMASTTKDLGPGVVPNFLGMDKAAALQLAEDKKISVQVNGFGVVTRQSIEAGSMIEENVTLKLTFSPPSYVE